MSKKMLYQLPVYVDRYIEAKIKTYSDKAYDSYAKNVWFPIIGLLIVGLNFKIMFVIFAIIWQFCDLM